MLNAILAALILSQQPASQPAGDAVIIRGEDVMVRQAPPQSVRSASG